MDEQKQEGLTQESQQALEQSLAQSSEQQEQTKQEPKRSRQKKQSKLGEDKTQKTILQKLMKPLGQISLLLVIVILSVYVITFIIDSGDFVANFSERSAFINFKEDLNAANDLAQVHYENLYEIAGKLEFAESQEAVLAILGEYVGSHKFGDLRYYSQGEAYTVEGVQAAGELSGNEMIRDLSLSQKAGCSDVYFDKMVEVNCVAFFVPVRGSVYVDGVLSIVPARNIIDMKSILPVGQSLNVLLDRTGRVLGTGYADDFSETVGNDFYDFVIKLTDGKENISTLENAVKSGKQTTDSLDTATGGYTVCISPIEGFGNNLYLATFTDENGLVTPELTYIRHVVNISVLAILSLLSVLCLLQFRFRKTQTALEHITVTDPLADCPNAEQFRSFSNKLLQNRDVRYAVVVAEIRQFQFLSDKVSQDRLSEMLRAVAKAIETFCTPHETYGYNGEGRFTLLMVCEKERIIRERIRLIENVLNQNAAWDDSRAKRKFNVGVSLTQSGKRQSIQELLSYATLACEKAKHDINVPYVIFNEQISTERNHHDNIEAEMETALVNNEFRLFLQPKYNVAEDRIDSAEALVRWFDTKRGDYRFPGEFIGLFETNGFIVKLDHFMYIEALKFLNASVERGEKPVPISVNVSMVTANNPDFVDFYVENKIKYKIPDGFIWVEFTESVTMSNYQNVCALVNKLHHNGIRCSLDDFGTGYASLAVLKNVPFDEVKFDRVFIYNGISNARDKAMLEAMYILAKSLGVRVVQEGVETKEMFDQVTARGGDVVQGYYYAKAIPVEEYRLFINSNTSIKYKSRVK